MSRTTKAVPSKHPVLDRICNDVVEAFYDHDGPLAPNEYRPASYYRKLIEAAQLAEAAVAAQARCDAAEANEEG